MVGQGDSRGQLVVDPAAATSVTVGGEDGNVGNVQGPESTGDPLQSVRSMRFSAREGGGGGGAGGTPQWDAAGVGWTRRDGWARQGEWAPQVGWTRREGAIIDSAVRPASHRGGQATREGPVLLLGRRGGRRLDGRYTGEVRKTAVSTLSWRVVVAGWV